MDPERTRELVATAAELGRTFATRAAAHDRDASFPHENYDDLAAAGFLGLCIPERFGGIGADYRTYALVSAELGRHCGATALTFNMHSCTMMWTGLVVDSLGVDAELAAVHDRNRAAVYELAHDGKIFAQPFSEPDHAVAAGRAPFGTTARPVDGGWLVSGMKHFASLAGEAHHYGILCTEEVAGEPPDPHHSLYLFVDAADPGFAVTGVWDPLGMRATSSRNLELHDVFVPESRLGMPRGVYFAAATRWPHMFLTLCPTYMGIAQATFDFTVAYLRGEAPGGPTTPQRDRPVKQYVVAQMRAKLDAARALFLQAIGEAGPDPDKDARLRALTANYTVMEAANELSDLAIRTCGGRSIAKALPLERLYRDSRCGSLMLPWSAETCLERVGHASLYESGERD